MKPELVRELLRTMDNEGMEHAPECQCDFCVALEAVRVALTEFVDHEPANMLEAIPQLPNPRITFAAAAVTGIMARDVPGYPGYKNVTAEAAARAAWAIADAMCDPEIFTDV